MTSSGEFFLNLGRWLLPFVWLLGLNLVVASSASLPSRARWVGAGLAALSPTLLPPRAGSHAILWGIAATVLTTIAVVSTARFADLASFRAGRARNRAELFLWMTLPMVLEQANPPLNRIERRRAALGWFSQGLRKELACAPLLGVAYLIDGDRVSWPMQSALLILYFVLNLTAATDLFCAVCALLGFRVQSLFDAPLLSRSPRDFWSRRWNRFISRFALKHVALPLGRRLPQSLVIVAVFGTSGLFHEYFAWGVGGEAARHGPMIFFFLIQGVVVWIGTRLRLSVPIWAATPLTFGWMMLSAPLFFSAIQPALVSFGYPPDWIPRPDWLNLLTEMRR